MGTELSFYMALCFLVPLAMVLAGIRNISVEIALATIVALGMPAVSGFVFRGGPVFRLMQIELRRRDGQRVSRWRCAWRTLLAWAPLTLPYSMLGIVTARLLASVRDVPPGQTPAPIATFGPGEGIYLFSAICGGEFLAFWFLVGAIVAVVSPRRGLQDLLAGTRLTPE
jgi:hypothetical protein